MKVYAWEADRIKFMMDAFADGMPISLDGHDWDIRAIDAVRTVGHGKVFEFTLTRITTKVVAK